MKIPDWLILCICECLLGEVYPAIRAIAVSLEGDGVLTMKYHLDHPPRAGDVDATEIVATNISSAIGVDVIKSINILLECSDLRLGELDSLDGFVYCRREYDIDDVR